MSQAVDKKRAPSGAGDVVSERTITVPHTAYSIAGTLTATFGNVLQPIFPVVWISVVAFGAALAAVLLLKRAGRPVMKGIAGFAVMGFLVSAFLLAVQYAPRSDNSRKLAQQAGAVAATVPGLIDVQNAVLPIDDAQKETTRFRLAIARGEEEDRGVAARAMLDAAEDPNMRAALTSIAFKSDVKAVKQAGLSRALSERIGALLPINIDDAKEAPTIAALFQGAQFALTRFDANTGVAVGALTCATGRWAANGVLAGGSLTLTGQCYDKTARAYRTYRIIVEPDASLGLKGEATIDAETARISIPLL